MDELLAEEMTRIFLEKDILEKPEVNDFAYFPTVAGKVYKVLWTKDVNVVNPKWHISVERQDEP